MTGYWSFRPGEDLEPEVQSTDRNERHFRDRATGGDDCTSKDVSCGLPGAPLVGSCVIFCDADTAPELLPLSWLFPVSQAVLW